MCNLSCHYAIDRKIYKGVVRKITMKKTLKDIEIIITDEGHRSESGYNCSELNKELIKWMKKDYSDWQKGPLFQSEIIERWRERLNLKDEDFK